MIFLRGLFIFAFLTVLTAVAVTDWKTQTIPDRFHVLIFLLGILAIRLFPEIDMQSRMLGIIVLSVPMLLLALISPGFFGGGDIKLAAVCGWLLGWRAALFAGVVSVMTGGIFCVAMLVTGRMSRKDHFAFGPFLALGFGMAVFVMNFHGG